MKKKSAFNLKSMLSERSKQTEKEQIEGQITLQDWLEWKEDIRNRLEETAENFVVIGYRLKQIRDSKLYQREYGSLAEFAQKEYNLSSTVVYRLIKINDEFSENGNSMQIAGRYRGYGFSKLQEMLYLTEEQREEVTEEMTVKEIRQMRQAETPSDRVNTQLEAVATPPKNESMEGDSEVLEQEDIGEDWEEEKAAGGREYQKEDRKEKKEQGEAWKEPAPEKKDIKLPPTDAVYRERMGKTMLEEITGGSRRKEKKEQGEAWKEPAPEKKDIKLPPTDAVYRERMGKTMLEEITGGSRRYVLIKAKHRFRVGNTVILRECEKGKPTGKIVSFKVEHMTDDSGGLIPGYCILGFLEFEESEEEVREDEE